MTGICPSNSYTGHGPIITTNPGPANAFLCTDQVILSPSSVYVAVLQTDGNLVVSRGSQPYTGPSYAAWATN